jgi:hypothetical protein
MAKTIIVRTSNQEIYNKLNDLKFNNECYIKIDSIRAITRMISNINRKQTLIEPFFGEGKVLLKKINSIKHVQVYHTQK